jgi:hypothetical protein
MLHIRFCHVETLSQSFSLKTVQSQTIRQIDGSTRLKPASKVRISGVGISGISASAAPACFSVRLFHTCHAGSSTAVSPQPNGAGEMTDWED